MKETFKSIVLPSTVSLMFIVSILLWMPFGMGYYDFPWDRIEARIGIQVFAFCFIVFSLVLLIHYISNEKLIGIGFSMLSLIVSLWSIFALYSWKDKYIDFLERRDTENKSEQSE